MRGGGNPPRLFVASWDVKFSLLFFLKVCSAWQYSFPSFIYLISILPIQHDSN
jgi:hypothetical protein